MIKLRKYRVLVAALALGCAPLASAEEAESVDMAAELGYFYGYSFGNMLKDGRSEDVDLERLMQGLIDSLGGQPPALDAQKREAIFAEVRRRQAVAQAEREQAAAAQAEAEQQQVASNLKAAEEFLAENAKRAGVMTTASGLQYEALQEAEGPVAMASSRVVVKYKGSFTDGRIFDQSGDTTVEFSLGQVISGWTEGLQLMSVGDIYKLYLHPDLGYGAGGVGQIPGNSVLVFEIELVEIK